MACLPRLAHRLALAGLCLASCGGPAPSPRWIELARGFQPEPLAPLVRAWQSEAGMGPDLREEPWCLHVREPMPLERWTRVEDDTWTAALPGGAFAWGSQRFMLLRSDTLDLTAVGRSGPLPESSFRIQDGLVELRLGPGATPPADLALTLRMESGRLPSDGVWQVRTGNEFGAGIPLWTGRAAELTCDLPARSRLTFQARFVPGAEGEVTLRVRLDGELLYERGHPTTALEEPGAEIEIELPRAARARARLRFEAEGPLGQVLLLRPLVAPAERGRPGARPWPEARPDIVLFLADTFRADGLAAYGGPADLAPALNAFAEQAVRFRNARSNAAWTLPSISTLLTGLAPGQHTANESGRALPDSLATIAEILARSGYRTGAVTDAAFFTPIHGLEQGFESFVMNQPAHWDLDWTLARAREFLARDDGRPLFLLVHTYRVHMPYRVGPEEDLGPWRALLASGCALLQERGKLPREEWRARLERCRAQYCELYRDGVRDLDRGFGELLSELDREGFASRGYVLFTSDHGEALGENEDIFHDGKLWDSKLRIPLLLRGPGQAARDVELGATLLDVAPTLAALAGLPREPRWPGSSLLALEHERPSWAFMLKKGTEITLSEGGRKLFATDPTALERGEPEEAYDLARDPGEEHPLAEAPWASELALRHAALLRALLEPATPSVTVPLSSAQQRELGQLGYGGEDEQQ